jgi:hypothetical protein
MPRSTVQQSRKSAGRTRAVEQRCAAVRCLIILVEHGGAMRTAWIAGFIMAALLVVPLSAEAGKVEGVGIGAGVGAVVLGPVGAVVGGVVGYKVGGPNLINRRYRSCWRDTYGNRHCRHR